MILRVRANDPTLRKITYLEGRSTWVVLAPIHDRAGEYLSGSMTGNRNGTVSAAKEISMVNTFETGQIGFSMTDLVGKPKL